MSCERKVTSLHTQGGRQLLQRNLKAGSALTSQAPKHLITILKVCATRALKRAFGIMNTPGMLVAIKLFSKPDATYITTKLSDLCMHRPCMLQQVILTFKLEGTNGTSKSSTLLMDGSQMLEQIGASGKPLGAQVTL